MLELLASSAVYVFAESLFPIFRHVSGAFTLETCSYIQIRSHIGNTDYETDLGPIGPHVC